MNISFTKQGLAFRPIEPSDLFMLMQHRNANLSGLRTPIPIMGMTEQEKWYESLGSNNMAFMAADADVPLAAVGMLRISNIEWPNQCAGLTGTDVFVHCRGKGFGTRILRGGAEWLIEELGMHRVTAEAAAFNVAAQRIIEKANFTKEGVKRQYLFRMGQWHDFYQYSLLKEEM